jgi:ribonuclease HII
MPAVDPTLDTETRLFAAGASWVLGIDECGRGAIAGPATVSVVAVHPDQAAAPDGIRDSKALSARKRDALDPAIRAWAPIHGVGHASAADVDEHGISAALALAAVRAITQARARADHALVDLTHATVLLDGTQNWLAHADIPYPIVLQEKADRDCLSVAAASVIGKVERDRDMTSLAATHPGYGFEGHKGYGAAGHYAAIAELGLLPGIHRATWIRR